MPITKLSSSLALVSESLKKAPVVQVEQDTNHVLIIDCSGSMSYELPKIRSQLKNRLPSLVKENDTVTIIWFSGRNEFGTLIEGVEFGTAKDLQNANAAIDRWLKPIGLTGFKQPLEEAKKVIANLSKKNKNVNSVFFLTDGYDNQWSKGDILNVCSVLGSEVSASTLVEYGYYCNRPLMSDMAETMGAALIFAEDFSQYDPTFENAIRRRVQGGKKIKKELAHDAHKGVVYAISQDQVVSFKADAGTVLIPESVDEIYYLTKDKVKEENPNGFKGSVLYAGMSIYSQRMLADEVLALLKFTGDAKFIKQFGNCFGKQAYSKFQQDTLSAVFNPKMQLTEGCDPNLVPDENAYTVLDALNTLMEDDDNKFYPYHDAFEYSRIGRATNQTSEVLTEDEEAQVAEWFKAAKTKAKLVEAQAKVDALIASKPKTLAFEIGDRSKGYSVGNLVMNETRPNVSIQVRVGGTVALDSPPNDLPSSFPSFIYRNYTIIKDGILNVKVLPVSLSGETFKKLNAQGVLRHDLKPISTDQVTGDHVLSKGIYLLDLSKLPIINRRMIREVSARVLFEQSYKLEILKAGNKVLKDYLKEFDIEKSKGFVDQYGPEATAWLKEQGITEFSGFSPKVTLAESTDFYMGKEIKISIKGLSSLPSVKDVKKAMEAKKTLTISQSLIADAIKTVESIRDGSSSGMFQAWLEGAIKANKKATNDLRAHITEQKFSVVVGQVWFKEFASLDDNSLNVDFGSFKKVPCTVNLNEIEVKI